MLLPIIVSIPSIKNMPSKRDPRARIPCVYRWRLREALWGGAGCGGENQHRKVHPLYKQSECWSPLYLPAPLSPMRYSRAVGLANGLEYKQNICFISLFFKVKTWLNHVYRSKRKCGREKGGLSIGERKKNLHWSPWKEEGRWDLPLRWREKERDGAVGEGK